MNSNSTAINYRRGYQEEGNLIYLFDRGRPLEAASQHLDNKKSLKAPSPLSNDAVSTESTGGIMKDEGKMKINRRMYTIDGDKVYISGNSEQEVAEKYSKLILERRGNGGASRQSATDFGQYSDMWLAEKVRHSDIGKGCAADYAGHLKQLKAYFQGKSIESITRNDLQRFFDQYSQQAKSTNNKKKIVLQQVFDYAVGDTLITHNPVKDKQLRVGGYEGKKRPAVPADILNRALDNLPNIKGRNERLLFALTAYTGMRRGEAAALQWSDIDWQKKVISVTKAVAYANNTVMVKPPKSKDGNRVVFMTDTLEAILLEEMKAIRDPNLSGYIVCQGDGSLLTEHMLTGCAKRAIMQIGLAGYTLHSLRHSMASKLMKDGEISLNTIKAIMGHADISTTAKMYAEVDTEVISEVGRLFSRETAM